MSSRIGANAERAEIDDLAVVRLGEMPARVKDDIPIDAVLLHEVRQERLAEILIVEPLAGRQRLDLGPRRIHDLPGGGGGGGGHGRR